MSRSRNIKPGFFKNEDLAECSPWARLCFAGLWTIADREGRLEDRPKRIKGDLFAFDSVEVDPLLDELQKYDFILRYQVDGRRFIQILEFSKHQNPHHKEAQSVIPSPKSPGLLPNAENTKPGALDTCNGIKAPDKPETSPGLSPQDMQFHAPGTVLIPDSLNLIPDSGEEREKPPSRSRGTRLPADWSLTPERLTLAADADSRVDARREAAKFRDYWLAATGKTAVKADWDATWRNWIRRAGESLGPPVLRTAANDSPAASRPL